MSTFGETLLLIYMAISCGVGLTWPLWLWLVLS